MNKLLIVLMITSFVTLNCINRDVEVIINKPLINSKSSADRCMDRLHKNGMNDFKECTTCIATEEYKHLFSILNKNARKKYLESLSYEEKERLFRSHSMDEWQAIYNQMDPEEQKLVPYDTKSLENFKPGILSKTCSTVGNIAIAGGKGTIALISVVSFGAGIVFEKVIKKRGL